MAAWKAPGTLSAEASELSWIEIFQQNTVTKHKDGLKASNRFVDWSERVENTEKNLNKGEADAASGQTHLAAKPADSGDHLFHPRPWPHDGVVRVWAY
jgi:hypothetical protein